MRIPIVVQQAMLEKVAELQKEALPWAALLKGITTLGTKAWANPLARRAIIGGAVGGTANAAFGSRKTPLMSRFLSGAALGAVGGAAYHGATRMGMPTFTQGINKIKPMVSQGIGKVKPIFTKAPGKALDTAIKVPETVSAVTEAGKKFQDDLKLPPTLPIGGI